MESVLQRAADGVMATETNKNPILQATTWLLLALSSLVLIFWLVTKFYIKTQTLFVLGDSLMLASYLFALGESIALIVPNSTAFGRDMAELSEEQLSDSAKIGYARDILFLLSIGFSKLSTCESLHGLSPDKAHHRWAYLLALSVIIWMITAIFGTAFQCGARGPWSSDRAACINLGAFLKYVDITSILIDVGLVALPIAIIYPLQIALRLRLTVMSFFSIRILVIAATICQLVYLETLFLDNYTLLAFPYYISMQLVLFVAILAAYIIYFWPFMRSLQSGLMSATALRLTSQYPLARGPKSTSRSTTPRTGGLSQANRGDYIELTPTYDRVHLAPAKNHLP